MTIQSALENNLNVSMTLPITENQSVVVTFEKIEYGTLYYSMEIADMQISLTAEAIMKHTEDEMIGFDFEDRAVVTFFKLLMVDEFIQLSKIYYLVECAIEINIAPYGFCSCGFYRMPVWDEKPDLALCSKCDKHSY